MEERFRSTDLQSMILKVISGLLDCYILAVLYIIFRIYIANSSIINYVIVTCVTVTHLFIFYMA